MTSKKRPSTQTPTPPETPRNLLPIEKTLLHEAGRKVRIRSDGADQEISTEEVVLRKMIQTAASGSPHAQGHFIRILFQAQNARAEVISEEVAEGYRILKRARDLLEKSIEKGRDPKLCVPHPDDIIVTEGVGWQLRGPFDEAELATILKRCNERDLLLAQGKLEERLASPEEWRKAESNFELRPDASAMVVAELLDMTLPKRFRMTFEDHMRIEWKFNRMTKRELLKYMHEAWRKIGNPVRRGARLPGLAYIKHAATAFKQTLSLMETQDASGRPMSERDIAGELTQQFRSAPEPFVGKN
jgi:hypothetical protein